MKQWIVFDLDGTLIESEQIWCDVRRQFVVERRGDWRPDAQQTMMGMRTQEWARYMRTELGVGLPEAQIKEEVVARIVARFSQGVPVLPGADEVLDRLAGAFILGVATSSALDAANAVLAKTGWQRYFAAVVSADAVDRGKPAPDVYLRALAEMDADAARTAAIEDSTNGIRSAHAAQLAVIAIPNREFPPDADALSLAASIVSRLDDIGIGTIRDALEAE
jgi:HAD superfamily hydrolase (TIGR01509 family)